MGAKLKDNPFQAGTGHVPAMLAGRDDEMDLLTQVIERLDSPRADNRFKLAKPPFPPVKIVGPRGVGKTVLLNWSKEQATNRFIRFESCEGLKRDQANLAMQKMLENIAGGITKMLRKIQRFGVSVAGKAGMDVQMREAELIYTDVVKAVMEAEPLLLLLDEVQHYDLALLGAVLQGSQKLIGEGYPLGLVLAGTPGLDSHLRKAESTFIIRSQKIYINTLNDAATREALKVPLKQEDVKVTPAALKAMAAQTDNYPYFIQLVGQHVWNAMAKAGREDIDVKLVRQAGDKARKEREFIYTEAYNHMSESGLLPYARQVLQMIESNGGQVKSQAIIDMLIEKNAGVDYERAHEIRSGLQNDGFIWSENNNVKPGIPSFFDYFKREEGI